MAEGTATGTVKAKNSHRVYVKETAANSEFFKSLNSKGNSKIVETKNNFSVVPNDYKRFRLDINFNNTYTRQLIKTFHATATNGFDYGLESKINANDILKSDAFWVKKTETFLAQGQAFDENLKIPLAIKISQNIPITVRNNDIQNFETIPNIYVHDIENDIYVDLKKQDFNINLESGNYLNRFEITFKKNTLNIGGNKFEHLKVYKNNNLSKLTINNSNSLIIDSFQLFDVTGKLVIHKKIDSNKTRLYILQNR